MCTRTVYNVDALGLTCKENRQVRDEMTALMLRISADQGASEPVNNLLDKPHDAKKHSRRALEKEARTSSESVKVAAAKSTMDESGKLSDEGTRSRKRKDAGQSLDGAGMSVRRSNKSSLEKGGLCERPVCGPHTPGSDNISWRIFP